MVTANKQLIAQHGDELVAAAREGGAQLRFEAAVAGAIPVIRVVQESLGAIPIEKVFGIVNGTTNYILTEMARSGLSYEEALKQAQELGYAEADPTEDVGGADAAAKMAILARLAFGAPGRARRRPLRGDRADQARRPRLREGARPLAEAARRRRAGRRRRDQRPRLPLLPLPGPSARADRGPVQRGHGRVPGDHRDHHVRARRRRPETAAAVLGDVVSVIAGGSPLFEENAKLKIAKDVEMAFYLHLEVDDRPGVLAQVAEVLGDNEVSVRSVVQRGMGGEAQLIMVMHPVSREALRGRAREDRQARLPALAAALDPRDRGRVRLGRADADAADRALPRPPARSRTGTRS